MIVNVVCLQRASAVLLVFALLLSMSCGAPGGPRDGPAPASGAHGPQRKSITIVLPAEINALATDLGAFGAISKFNGDLHPFINGYVTLRDDEDQVRPHLAAELPSFDAGTWKLLDDGGMQVIWRLRKDVRWHDGAEFTSADLKFGWQVAIEPTTPIAGSGNVGRFIEGIETPDPYTAVIRWRQTSRFGGEMGRTHLHPLPRHLLEPAFLAEKEGFVNHPYFTAPESFAGAGPFRVIEWERGSQLTTDAFDQYFLGRPRIDRVTFRFIVDPRTALANMLAGSIDVAGGSIGFDGAVILQREWARSGGGTLLMQPDNFRHHLPQLRAEQASLSDLLNPAVRKALMYALNREQLVEGAFPGAGIPLLADSIVTPGTPLADAVGERLVRYPYDPSRAATFLQDAGWRRGADGILVKPGGDRFQLELRSLGIPERDKVFALMQQDYRQVGIDLVWVDVSGTQAGIDYAHYPGLLLSGLPINHPNFGARWHSRTIARPENRFTGSNSGGYSNPVVDRLLDDLDRAIQLPDQLRYWGEVWRILTDEVGVMSLYFSPASQAFRKGVMVSMPKTASGSYLWQLHEWDLQ
jgi:peptide/nickel transport system substrate-binding protein